MKQTAIEWLLEQILNNKGVRVISTSTFYIKDEVVEQAEEMFEQQIIDAYNNGQQIPPFEYAEQYYNETFNK